MNVTQTSEFPAQAGMNRVEHDADDALIRVPRASGDEPYLDKWFDKVNSEFPAQAGMNR